MSEESEKPWTEARIRKAYASGRISWNEVVERLAALRKQGAEDA